MRIEDTSRKNVTLSLNSTWPMKSGSSAHCCINPVAEVQAERLVKLDSKLEFADNGRRVSDSCLTFYKLSDDSHILDKQQLLYISRVYQLQCSRYFLPDLDFQYNCEWCFPLLRCIIFNGN